jgi:DNA adenine methylase
MERIFINQPVIKWSGSKRLQSNTIIQYFPKKINIYYEPFIGGGSMMFKLIHSDIEVNKIICTDINKDLIELWTEIKNRPYELVKGYKKLWEELNENSDIARKKKYYYAVRDRFNKQRSPIDFIFINRTTTNGLIRYNKKGDFNNSFHSTRNGMDPDTLLEIVLYWNNKINEKNIEFICINYEEIQTTENDFLYLDPPYANTKGMYFGAIDYPSLWNWLRNQKSKYLLSFDGKSGLLDNTYNVPLDLYDQHIYIKNAPSSFKLLMTGELSYVEESLYIKK